MRRLRVWGEKMEWYWYWVWRVLAVAFGCLWYCDRAEGGRGYIWLLLFVLCLLMMLFCRDPWESIREPQPEANVMLYKQEHVTFPSMSIVQVGCLSNGNDCVEIVMLRRVGFPVCGSMFHFGTY